MAAPNLNQLAVVLFAAPPPAPAAAGPLGLVNPVLQCSGMELATFCINQTQRNALAAPGRNVSYVAGSVTPDRVVSRRQSYINALIIQSRGTRRTTQCTECSRRGTYPFEECVSIPGVFGGACGACKWRDHGARCVALAVDVSDDEDNDDNNDDNVPVAGLAREPSLPSSDSGSSYDGGNVSGSPVRRVLGRRRRTVVVISDDDNNDDDNEEMEDASGVGSGSSSGSEDEFFDSFEE